MNQGDVIRISPFATCHPAGCCTDANPVNPVIVSIPQISSFQFQVSYTYSWVDALWTETVTRVHEQEPDPVPMQTTRRSTVHGRAGNRLAERTELLTAPGVWEQIDGMAYEYDVNGRETKRTAFNGLTTTSAWSGTCCGKSSETAPDGTRTTFTYDTAGRLVVRTVLDPVPIETHIAYDALGRRVATWTTNRVAQLGTPVLRTTYDALGRVVSSADELGNTTTYV